MPASPAALAIPPQRIPHRYEDDPFDGDFGLDDCSPGPDRDQRIVWDAAWRSDPRLLTDYPHLFDLSAREEPPLPLPEGYLDVEQAARYLNVQPRMVRRMVERGDVTVRRVGKFLRFSREDLDAAVTVVPAQTPLTRRPVVPADDPILDAVQTAKPRSARASGPRGRR